MFFFTILATKSKEIMKDHQANRGEASAFNQELKNYLFRLDNEPFPPHVRKLIKEKIKSVIENRDNILLSQITKE
jgi:hypothetical protein